jgi:hypothetical protein
VTILKCQLHQYDAPNNADISDICSQEDVKYTAERWRYLCEDTLRMGGDIKTREERVVDFSIVCGMD